MSDISTFRDLSYLLFALRALYGSKKMKNFAECGFDFFCLIEVFCRYMCFKFPGKTLESFSLHLLSHFAWQCETFGPLWTTSSSLFELEDQFLIRPVTGFVSTCRLFVQRNIRSKEIVNTNLTEGSLKPLNKNVIDSKHCVNQNLLI